MHEPPLVSVVVPTCNRSDEIRKCVMSLVGQTCARFEVIVVDDGSSDGSADMLEAIGRDHPELNLTVLVNERNIGANPSRNRGVDAAQGTHIVFLDSDCVAEPDLIEKLIAGFTSEKVGAVQGMIVDPPPRNVYDLVFRGQWRTPGREANRFVSANLCVRRDLLIKYRMDEDRASPALRPDGTPDTSVSGRGDEEGLYLMLRAAGYSLPVAHDAVVLHEHFHTRRSFFRQGSRSGKSAARLVYKFHLHHRIDIVPFVLAYLTLPLMVFCPYAWMVPAFFFAGAVAAQMYNELFRKGKTVWQMLTCFPVLLIYYQFRVYAYVVESIRLRIMPNDVRRVRLT